MLTSLLSIKCFFPFITTNKRKNQLFFSVSSMVETAAQTTSRSSTSIVPPHPFFLGECFRPVGRPRGTTTHHATPSSSNNSNSLFTIESILAPKPRMTPSSQRPMLHNPNIHLGHVAAAAGIGFGPGSTDLFSK